MDENIPSNPVISLANNGTIFVAWYEGEKIVTRRFSGYWMPTETLTTDGLPDIGSLKIGGDANANQVAVWRSSDGSLWSSDYCLDAATCEPSVPEHEVVVEACINCHDGIEHTGVNDEHMPTSDTCQVCYSANVWKPAVLNHSATDAMCIECHNGVSASIPATGHFLSTNTVCEDCHIVGSWYAVNYNHISPNYVSHRYGNNCISCHTTNKELEGVWKTPQYQFTCAGCHSNNYKSAPHTKVSSTGQTYSVSELTDCSGACHVYADATLTVISSVRSNQHRPTLRAF